MSTEKDFHYQREQECRDMAAAATDPEIRRRHEELAELHASLKHNTAAQVADPAPAEAHV